MLQRLITIKKYLQPTFSAYFFHTISNMSDVVNDLLDLHDVIQLADDAMLLAEYLESLCVQVCCYFLVIKG